jgi:hypothetical protein
MRYKILGNIFPACVIAALAISINHVPAMQGDEPARGSDRHDRCLAAMQALSDGADDFDYFSDTIAIGPGLVHAMSGDQTAFPIGRPMLIMFRDEGYYFVGRFVKAEDGSLKSFLRSTDLKTVLAPVLHGRARPASQDEHDIYSSLAPFETDTQTITVIQDGSQRLLLDIEEDGRIFWMDMVSEYPIPSVADSMEEAMKLTKQIGERATGSEE